MKKSLILILLTFIFGISFGQTLTSKQKKIKEVLELTGSGKIGEQMAHSLFIEYANMYPEVPAVFWENVKSKIKADDLIALIIPIYEKHYTEGDLDEMIRFYKTTTGQKIISTLPLIMEESMKVGEKWGEKIAKDVYKELIDNKLIKDL